MDFMRIAVGILILTYCSLQKNYFSSKTSYREVGNMDTVELFPENYMVVYVRYVGRHGSRYPGPMEISNISSVFAHLAKHLPDVGSVVNFNSFPLDETYSRSLAPSGIKEMVQIGRRYRRRLGKVFDSLGRDYTRFKLESTCRARSIQSMVAFSSGMFPVEDELIALPLLETKPCENDVHYRFFDFCQYYTNYHNCKKESKAQQMAFMNGDEIRRAVDEVNKNLRLPLEARLNAHLVLSLYLSCAYNHSLTGCGESQGTCSFFSSEGLRAFEYLLDIKNYYKRANPLRLNIDISCPLSSRIYDSIVYKLSNCPRFCENGSQHSCRNKTDAPSGDFSFSHAETIVPVMGFFGLLGMNGSDYFISDTRKHLTSNNYHNLKDSRVFRGAVFSPMAGNLALVAACPTGGEDEGSVMVLLNEHPISLPCCGNDVLPGTNRPVCKLNKFISCFEEKVGDCQFLNMCGQDYKCDKDEGDSGPRNE